MLLAQLHGTAGQQKHATAAECEAGTGNIWGVSGAASPQEPQALTFFQNSLPTWLPHWPTWMLMISLGMVLLCCCWPERRYCDQGHCLQVVRPAAAAVLERRLGIQNCLLLRLLPGAAVLPNTVLEWIVRVSRSH